MVRRTWDVGVRACSLSFLLCRELANGQILSHFLRALGPIPLIARRSSALF